MSIVTDRFPVMPTRPCSFCLRLMGGSVFADFETDDSDQVSLCRISFDGFGCCEVKGSIRKMDPEDSRTLHDALNNGGLGTAQVDQVLRKYFRANMDVIWSDALAEHDLL